MAASLTAPALNSSNVRAGISGGVLRAPVGTTMPATPTATPNAAFGETGYITKDGIKEKPDVKRSSIVAWQNNATVRERVEEAKLTFEFALMETTAANVEAYYGTTVTQTATHGTYTVDPGASSGVQAWIMTVIDGANIKVITIDRGELFKASDGVAYDGGEIAYPCELVCYTNPNVMDTALKTP